MCQPAPLRGQRHHANVHTHIAWSTGLTCRQGRYITYDGAPKDASYPIVFRYTCHLLAAVTIHVTVKHQVKIC